MEGLDRDDAHDLALWIVDDDAGFSAHEQCRDAGTQAGLLLEQSEDEGAGAAPLGEGPPGRASLAAAVSVEGGVGGAQLDQLVEVAVASSRQEGPQEGVALLWRGLVTGALDADVAPGPAVGLPAVGLALL